MNMNMANKGQSLEVLVEHQNAMYLHRLIAKITKVDTKWVPERADGKITGAHVVKKSGLDFAGCLMGGHSIKFDCKQSEDPRGLLLKNIKEHQIKELREAERFAETAFLVCEILPLRKCYVIPSETAIQLWDRWQGNKGLRGFNIIPVQCMTEIESTVRGPCDYLAAIEESRLPF